MLRLLRSVDVGGKPQSGTLLNATRRADPPAVLPKTRSGKILRRILRKIAPNEHDALGNISTLADPAVDDDLVGNRMNRK